MNERDAAVDECSWEEVWTSFPYSSSCSGGGCIRGIRESCRRGVRC